jgi:hypothetical protein
MEDARYNFLVGVGLLALIALLITLLVSLTFSHAGEIAGATGAVVGGMAGACGANAGVRAAIAAERETDSARRKVKIGSIRLALYTELRTLADQARIEGTGWSEIATRQARHYKQLITAKLPHPIIYPANADKIGLLSEVEIMNIVRFYSQIKDAENLADSLIQRNNLYNPAEAYLLARMFGHGCSYAGEFMEAAQSAGFDGLPGAEHDAPFIAQLKQAVSFGEMRPPSAGPS